MDKTENSSGHNIRLAYAEDIRRMDEYEYRHFSSPVELMEKAGYAVFDTIISRPELCKPQKVVVYCGSGGNGGDGFVLARLLTRMGYDVTVVMACGTPPEGTPQFVHYNALSQTGAELLTLSNDNRQIIEKVMSAGIIIDAVFGIGYNGSLPDSTAWLFDETQKSPALKMAVDVPSGIYADDGRVDPRAFRADVTVTFAYIKAGMASYPAFDHCGDIIVADIGYNLETVMYLQTRADNPEIIGAEYIRSLIPKRRSDSNKGDFGKMLSICGSPSMTGAAYLSALGALRCGVGLICLAADKHILPILQNKLNEPIFFPLDYDNIAADMVKLIERMETGYFSSVLFGCGLGISPQVNLLLGNLLHESKCPLILDADGINTVARNINILNGKKSHVVLTPHPGEMARLSGKTVADVQSDRMNTARSFAAEYECTVVLKGARTIIATPEGRVYINPTGNPGLAKGGSGDVLAGMIASFAAQGMGPVESACAAVYLHGLAGDICASETSEAGFLPSDLPLTVAKLMK